MNNGHARLSPSGASRWMSCTGSIAMEDGLPSTGNEYSDEGTAAHALASMCLTEGTHPSVYTGRLLHVIDGAYSELPFKVGAKSNRSFEVDAEMVEAVAKYVAKVLEYRGNHQMFVEQSLPIGHITGEEGATGTGDAVIVLPDELQAHDLKYGMGVQVFAENNEQLMLYLLGALEKFPGEYARYRAVIHQPRLNVLDEWTCTHEELMAFADKARTAANAAMLVLEVGEVPAALLKPTEKACKFCKAKATCPGLAKFVTDTIGADFEALGTGEPDLVNAFVPAELIELGRKNSAIDLIETWCKAIRAKVEAALIEHNNSAEAIAELGHKLVQGKKGNRAWSSKDEAEAAMKKMRFKVEQIYDLSVKSPTVIEKAIAKDHPKWWGKLSPLVTQRDGVPSVAPVSDKRAALVMKPVVDDFEVTETWGDLV